MSDRARGLLAAVSGALSMYVATGAIIAWAMVRNTTGECPWWLPLYWTATWLWQLVEAGIHGGAA